MKFVSINIECNKHTPRVRRFLAQEAPDIVCMQELLEEDVYLYKQELGYDAVYLPWYTILPIDYKQLVGKRHGLAIFAKQIVDRGSFFLADDAVRRQPSTDVLAADEHFYSTHAAVWADVAGSQGKTYRCVTTQLPVTHKGEVTTYQLEAVDALLSRLKDMGELILSGDMNAPRGREAFDRIAAVYRDNIPAEYTTSIDQHLHRVKGIQLMVDGLFTTPAYQASQVRLVDGVSDHMAVVAEVHKQQAS